MSAWTEDVIRKAASWKAFKEGAALADSGVVSAAKMTAQGWSGAVSGGRRPWRVSVVMRSATDVEARCSCPANQSSGEFCAHAVAVGLSMLRTPAPSREPAGEVASPQAMPAKAWTLAITPRWQDVIARGQLPVLLVADEAIEPSAADRRLSGWLHRQPCQMGRRLRLNPSGKLLAEFLELVVEHPRVRIEGSARPLSLAHGGHLALADAIPSEGQITLTPIGGVSDVVRIDSTYWHVSEEGLLRVGDGELPASLKAHWEKWLRGQPCRVEVGHFLRDLDVWQDWLAFPEDGWLASLRFVADVPRFQLRLDGNPQRLSAKLRVRYGGGAWMCPERPNPAYQARLEGERCVQRHLAAEREAVSQLESCGFLAIDAVEANWQLQGEGAVQAFLAQGLEELGRDWELIESGAIARFRRSVVRVSPSIEILGSGADWLSFDIKFKTADGNSIPNGEVRAILGGARNLKGGARVVVGDQWKQVFEPMLEELELRQVAGHYEASARSAEVVREIRNNCDKSFRGSGGPILDDFEIPAGFAAELRPYQRHGAAWLWDRVERFGGALLADDMGLGKTVQTIVLAERMQAQLRPDAGVVLVVVTASLLGNWRAEWQRFAPGRRVQVMHGGQRDALRERIEPGDVVLTTYATLARDLAWHLRQDYRLVVADEASLMRNPNTDHAKALAKLKAGARVALTGTPVENGVQDLWSIFRFIQPGWLGGRKEFAERYAGPAGGDAGAMSRLKLKISPFVLRRTKDQVAPELPAKWVIDEYCDLTAEQQSVYQQLLEEGRKKVEVLEDAKQAGAARMQVLTALLRLRQTCGDLALLGSESLRALPLTKRSAKLSRLMELLEGAHSGGHKVLVFSQFQKQLLAIEEALVERGWNCLRLDGQSRNRQDLVDRFQSPEGPSIFLISLKAGGYGLNLTAADTVVHFDPWWNPAAEAQATDRAHRIGQVRPVTVYRLLTRGTVEEKVVGLQLKKRQLAAMVDESGEGDVSGMSLRELEGLLAGA